MPHQHFHLSIRKFYVCGCTGRPANVQTRSLDFRRIRKNKPEILGRKHNGIIMDFFQSYINTFNIISSPINKDIYFQNTATKCLMCVKLMHLKHYN